MYIFNKSAIKKMGTSIGIKRESSNIVDIIEILAEKYLYTLLFKIVEIINYSNRKTIGIIDLQFLEQIENNNYNFNWYLYISGVETFILKKPFMELVRRFLKDITETEIRIAKGVGAVLQIITEQYILNILKAANKVALHCKRDTLFVQDIAFS